MRKTAASSCLLVLLVAAGCSAKGPSGQSPDGGAPDGAVPAGAPSTPGGLSVGSPTASSLSASWNSASGASSYQLFRDTSAGGSFSDKVYDSGDPSFVDTGLAASTTYYYKVQATNASGSSALSDAASGMTSASTSGDFTAAQILTAVHAHMTTSDQVNTKPHINTMTRAMNVNVYQVTSGVYAYSSSMAVDTDGSDPDPDPDHQPQTTWTDDNGVSLGAHHVPYYVLGDYCYDKVTPCPHFFYGEHDITGLQFALIFYNGHVIGAVFGDTQGDSVTPTSDNDSRELGEASVQSAALLGIPSSGTTGGVDSGVTVVIFSGPQWVVKGTNATLSDNAQALVQKALNQLGASFGL
jgi:hypothetical protein